ncbi:MAG: cobalt-precorrin-5B (C(1))-methyltransferase CbiD [Candidatus Obscuribacterales bacterium]|nr:cobalt-precorrin-5B (C(1))-methyltransferase CbiD [Candidatus Obscuribacterales bacterium]
MSELEFFDLTQLAENGLRRGRTTGTCAAAAVKAAIIVLLGDPPPTEVAVTLPDKKHYLRVPVDVVNRLSSTRTRAEVTKFAGDDPDQTDGARIFVELEKNETDKLKFIAGVGVGVVTAPGIRVPVGEPAINPAPREMISIAIEEALNDHNHPKCGFDITIGCINGEVIAKKTFNPRLGIEGGISILGTTGIVEPMSLAAYQASIEVYVRVGLFDLSNTLALLPGNLGLNFAKDKLGLQTRQIVHVSNFIGFAIEATERSLQEQKRSLPELWLLGHPGKLAKLLDGHWDTHSRNSPMAMSTLADLAEELGMAISIVELIRNANTVEAIVQDESQCQTVLPLWVAVQTRLSRIIQERTPSVDNVQVRLFSMTGKMLTAELAA